MNGRVIGIAGVTVRVAMTGLKLYDQVRIGPERLIGEVVRLSGDQAIIQVYEELRGLKVGDGVESVGGPLTVCLGPGLLGTLYDGLQRPLAALQRHSGPFIAAGATPPACDPERRWPFEPCVAVGERVAAGQAIGYVPERSLRHPVLAPCAGTVKALATETVSAGEPVALLDNGDEVRLLHSWPVRERRPAHRLRPASEPLVTGQRCLDFLFPMVQGGVAAFPGGFGTGKTVLEQTIARHAEIDIVVYVGCGERGNEMAELLDEFAGLDDPRGAGKLLERTIIIANTSNMPVAAREASIYTGVAMAEYYRDLGANVLLLADSLSRWAEALREISASLEEMPGEEGYPTYLGSRLAAFLERAGATVSEGGRPASLSMMLAVSPPGGDFTEPVTQCCLRAAGAFYMLDSKLANARHFPAVNWSQSYSLYAPLARDYWQAEIADDWGELVDRCRRTLLKAEELLEVAEIVGHEGLQPHDRLLLWCADRLQDAFLRQNAYSDDAFSSPQATVDRCRELLAAWDAAIKRLESGEEIDDILEEVRDARG